MRQENSRRAFLRDGLLLGIGASAGVLAPGVLRLLETPAGLANENEPEADPEKRLRELGIELPPPPQPVAVYVPAVQLGTTLYTSGHIPRRADGTSIVGKVGRDLTLEQGYEAARLVGVNILSTVRRHLGSLNQVVRLVKVLGVVNCTADFTQQPQVVNGFSELMIEVFGETLGKAARSAVGGGSLPGNMAVEIEAIFEVRAPRSSS